MQIYALNLFFEIRSRVLFSVSLIDNGNAGKENEKLS